MRIVTVEEHFALRGLAARVGPDAILARGCFAADKPYGPADPGEKMDDLGDKRLAAMDAAGVTMQILSYEGPGADPMPSAESPCVRARRTTRSHVRWGRTPTASRASRICRGPRPKPAPTSWRAASRSTASSGRSSTGRRSLPRRPALRVAAREGRGARRADLRASRHPAAAGARRVLRATAEGPVVHLRHRRLRLARRHRGPRPAAGPVRRARPACGADPRHRTHGRGTARDGGAIRPDVRRTIAPEHLQRPIGRTITDQVYVSTGGFVTAPPLRLLLDTFGIDRIVLFADHPFMPMDRTTAFLDAMPVSDDDREKIAPAMRIAC